MNTLLEHIQDGDQFEDLVAAYFRALNDRSAESTIQVDVKPTGVGTDGGVDLLVDIHLTDEIETFTRRWIVQCKFLDVNVGPSHLRGYNVPTLINSQNADGYLLICKKRPTSGLTNMFNNLNENCDRNYRYVCWSGTTFESKIRPFEHLMSHFFPNISSNNNSSL